MTSDLPRPGETTVVPPSVPDAGVIFIGRIRTPFRTRADCPRQGDPDGPDCQIEVDPIWHTALSGIAVGDHLDVLYWMHMARRDLVTQSPRHRGPTGTFALRSPARPNPIALSRVRVVGITSGVLIVKGLDCVDGTPLVDIKPARCGREPG